MSRPTPTAKPLLVDAVTGNGHLLLTLQQSGEPDRLFWPHIDYGQHIERWVEGIFVVGRTERTVWQDSPGWHNSQRYDGETNVLVSQSAHQGLALTITRTDAVVPRGGLTWDAAGGGPGQAAADGEAGPATVESNATPATPEGDLWVRRVTVRNEGPAPLSVTYLVYQSLWFEESPLYNTSLYNADADALVHYRRDVYAATGADLALSQFTCGRGGQAWEDAQDGLLSGAEIIHGDTQGALAVDLGVLEPGTEAVFHLFTALGRSACSVKTLLAAARQAGGDQLLAVTREADGAWLGKAQALRQQDGSTAVVPEDVLTLYRRSLLVMKLMTDAGTGAVIAAPEFDADYEHSGGYAYCWGRDAAYITVAMDRAGLHDSARAFYRWTLAAQEPEGGWVHRQTAEGLWGASWGLTQIDETGSILYGMAEHLALTGDADFAREVYDAVHRAAEYLLTQRHPTLGLVGPSVDLWEERTGYLTYSTAAVAAGLRGAAQIAEATGHGEDAARWRAAADAMAEAIRREGWNEARGAFLRMRDRQVDEAGFEGLRSAGEAVHRSQGPKSYTRYIQDREGVLDASLLGIAVPFAIVPAGDPAMESTARALEAALTAPGIGGLYRYEDDPYRGGNPWVLCTLWLGQYEVAAGRVSPALDRLRWALEQQTHLGLLPEQVDAATGQPAWVVPLTWSHAMFVLLVQQLAEAGAWAPATRAGVTQPVG